LIRHSSSDFSSGFSTTSGFSTSATVVSDPSFELRHGSFLRTMKAACPDCFNTSAYYELKSWREVGGWVQG